MEKPKQQNGFVIRALSGFFTVQTESGEEVVCKIPKWLRRAVKHEQMTRDQRISDIVAVGDRVTFIEDGGETGQIIEVAPRKRVLSRSRPAAGHRNKRFDREQVLVANPDQVILVFSIREPRPTLRKLDRFLVVTERNNLPTIICVNKIDLATREEAESLFSI
ncbi:MAG: GTPase RsgA, partial [Methylococcales bacterium]|nr:GTPase RsgA [Methylococcales bacterium]